MILVRIALLLKLIEMELNWIKSLLVLSKILDRAIEGIAKLN